MPAPNRATVSLEDARETYRYLRAGMVVMVGMLGAAVLIEWINVDCWQTSISAYYYTAVHSVFIAALCAIGVQLIVYKGTVPSEDGFLNLAGILAFIVAFVPTASPDDECGVLGTVTKWGRAITNNVVSIMIALILAGAILWIVYRYTRQQRHRTVGGWLALGVLWSVVLIGTALFVGRREFFETHAHNAAAILMFVAIIVTVFISAAIARKQEEEKGASHTTLYFWLYVTVAAAMIVSLGVVLAYRLVNEHWGHAVIVIEALLIIEFAIYWAIQTVELWNVESRIEWLPAHLQAAAEHTVERPTPRGFVQELSVLRGLPPDERLMRVL
jgi:hypothetical protein